MLTIDKTDRKLLALLDEDARLSARQLGRRVRLSSPTVQRRIERLEEEGIIFNHYTVIDFSRLGYSQYKVYLRLQDASLEDEERIVRYWERASNVIWLAQTRGRWDLAVSLLAKSNFEFASVMKAFLSKFARFVLERDVLLTEYSPIYAREYLTETKPKEFVYGAPRERVELDATDRAVLKVLATEARIPILELVKRTGASRDIVNYRIKRLKRAGIIVQHRCYPRLESLGVLHHKLLLRLKNLDAQKERELKGYAAANKRITQLLKLIGSWDAELELEVEDEEDLHAIIVEIRTRFAGVLRDLEQLRIVKTRRYDYFPFGIVPGESGSA